MDSELENLWKLHASAWASFQRRAGHEFRFSIAVWTAAVALIGLGLKLNFNFNSRDLWGAGVFLVLLVVLHLWYEWGMKRSNDTDLHKCYALEDVIIDKIDFKWPEDVQEEIKLHKNKGRIKKNWSHIGHVSITFVLALAVFSLLFTKAPKPMGETDETTSLSSDYHKQELKALRETTPYPAKGDEGESAILPGITDQPNMTNSAVAKKPRG